VIFSKGQDAKSYLKEKNDINPFRFKKQQQRGSSENWNDESEFVTPMVDKRAPEPNESKVRPFDL
jgi:hypothetical protein